jgi:hypothetical protein
MIARWAQNVQITQDIVTESGHAALKVTDSVFWSCDYFPEVPSYQSDGLKEFTVLSVYVILRTQRICFASI